MERKRERDKEEMHKPSSDWMDESEEMDTEGREMHSKPSRETLDREGNQRSTTPKKRK